MKPNGNRFLISTLTVCGTTGTHPCVRRQPREGERDVAIQLDDLADCAGILELGSCPPFHAEYHAVLALDANYG